MMNKLVIFGFRYTFNIFHKIYTCSSMLTSENNGLTSGDSETTSSTGLNYGESYPRLHPSKIYLLIKSLFSPSSGKSDNKIFHGITSGESDTTTSFPNMFTYYVTFLFQVLDSKN